MKKTAMTKDDVEKFIKELSILCDKYNIVNAAFTGEDKYSQKYIGVKSLSGEYSIFIKSLLNIGRLWQTAREGMNLILDGFEKK